MGGKSVGGWSTRLLKMFMFSNGAIDLKYLSHYTWSKRCSGPAIIKERLDRSIFDQEWQTLFPRAGVRNLVAPYSDHCPILLDAHLDNTKVNRPFCFEQGMTQELWLLNQHGMILWKGLKVLSWQERKGRCAKI